MPPHIASLVCWIAIAAMFVLDRYGRTSRPSAVLWIPALWIGIGGSRMVSQWFGGAEGGGGPEQYLDGSPLDRNILLVLLGAAIVALCRAERRARAATLLKANWPVVLFLVYCLVSAAWSEYPFVAVKRWTKTLGNFVMVVVVLTEATPADGVRQVLSRVGFVLMPLSVLLIKYYPHLGRGYDRWLGTAFYNGVALEKNSLGALCAVIGVASVWSLLGCRYEEDRRRRAVQFALHSTVLAMVWWLLDQAESATSLGCFALGATLVLLLSTRRGTHRALPLIHICAIVGPVVGWLSRNSLIAALGRDASLTGRTDLWDEFLAMAGPPLLGAGFESFFLGSRIDVLWARYWWHPNEAHNGYLETYLTLGWIGVALLAIMILVGYRNALRTYAVEPDLGTLQVALFGLALVYNLTESGVKVMHPVWVMLLLAVTACPRPLGWKPTSLRIAVRSQMARRREARRRRARPEPLSTPILQP